MPNRNLKTKLIVSAAAVAMLSGTPCYAFANDADTSVEEVVVTVRRRAEKLQDVPITVSAVAGQTLAVERLDRVQDYSAKIANFNALQQNTRVSTLTIRGVGARSVSGWLREGLSPAEGMNHRKSSGVLALVIGLSERGAPSRRQRRCQ